MKKMPETEKHNTKEEPQIVIPYGYVPYCPPEEDEIDLRELWRTLKKRKKTVWGVTFGVFFVALLYVAFASSIYEAKALLEVGSIEGNPLSSGQRSCFPTRSVTPYWIHLAQGGFFPCVVIYPMSEKIAVMSIGT